MRRAVLALIFAAFVTSSASGQELTAKAAEAEALAGQGKYAEALAVLDEAVGVLWDRSPLIFSRVLWVAEPPGGFGAFNPRETNVYAAGDQMLIYAEPIGFGWSKAGDVWRTDLSADLAIRSKDGEVLLSRNDFQKLVIGSRVRNREFMATFTLTLTGIPKGEYVADMTLRDQVTGKDGTLSLPFVIK